MTTMSPPPPDPDFSDLTDESVSRLLQLGLEGTNRPIDELIGRFSEPDGRKWLQSAMDASPLSAWRVVQSHLVDGPIAIEQLLAIKEESKTLLRNAEDADSRLAATWAYFVSIAAALVHHDSLICSRNRNELDPLLLDLAAAAPDPWSELLSRATLTPSKPNNR